MSLDVTELAKRATAAAGAGATVDDLRPLDGGLSSLTFAATIRRETAIDRIVVKVAPPGLPPVRNRDVLRQARVLTALSRMSDVAVPTVEFTDEGDPPDVPPFFAMRFVPGESIEPLNDDRPLPAPAVLTSRYLAAARMLAALHRVEPNLGLIGEAPVTLDAEVERWRRALDTVDDDLSEGHSECADALLERLPAAVPMALCHGDWRLGNMLCDGAEINAVIDWEIWSFADPRVDLAWFLAVSGDNPFAVRRGVAGVPDRDALIAGYEDVAGRSIGDLAWFRSLVDLKQAATMGLILKRNRRAEHPDPRIETHAPTLPRLLADAITTLRSD